MKQSVNLYRRSVDAGHGHQDLVVVNGVIKEQRLGANGNHSYTGNGNPELVGKPVTGIRGWGFKKVRMSDNSYMNWRESRHN